MRFLAGSTRVVRAPEDEVLAGSTPRTRRRTPRRTRSWRGFRGNGTSTRRPPSRRRGDLLESPDEAPVIRFVHSVLFRAIRERSSDIHFEPYEKELVVRNRVDASCTR